MSSSEEKELESILFPKGTNFDKEYQQSLIFKQYKIFVETSEKLVARRQTVNAFFLSFNALLFSAMGVISKEAFNSPLAAWGLVAIGAAGILLYIEWRTLVRSYRQLNKGNL